MRFYRVSFIAALASSVCSFAAADISACRGIEDSLERLSCYDDAVQDLVPATAGADVAFEEFKKLVHTDLAGSVENHERFAWLQDWDFHDSAARDALENIYRPLGWGANNFVARWGLVAEHAELSDCQLTVFRHWSVHAFYSSQIPQRWGNEDQFVFPSADVLPILTYSYRFDLSNVSVQDSNFRSVQMSRGSEIVKRTIVSRNFERALEIEDAESLGQGSLLVAEHLDRTMDVMLGWAYPEDSEEITAAFARLVSACSAL